MILNVQRLWLLLWRKTCMLSEQRGNTHIYIYICFNAEHMFCTHTLCFFSGRCMFAIWKDRNPLPFLLPFLSPSVIWANLRQVSSFGLNHLQQIRGVSSLCTNINSHTSQLVSNNFIGDTRRHLLLLHHFHFFHFVLCNWRGEICVRKHCAASLNPLSVTALPSSLLPPTLST